MCSMQHGNCRQNHSDQSQNWLFIFWVGRSTHHLHNSLPCTKYSIPDGSSQVCSEPINQHSQGNSYCLLYCFNLLTGNNEGNTAFTLWHLPCFKGRAISCHPKPTRDWDAVIYSLSCIQSVSLSRVYSNYQHRQNHIASNCGVPG